MIKADIKKIDNNIQYNNYFIYFQNKIVTHSKCYKVQIKNFKTEHILWGKYVSFFDITLIEGL